MIALPDSLMNSLIDAKGFDKNAFENVHASGEQVTSVRINPMKLNNTRDLSFGKDMEKVSWSSLGYYLSSRPSFTFDPLFHAGCYYVQEASSMFLEIALKQTVDLSQPLKILDLSAAPGGKSTHIQSLLSRDSVLVSNEVIRSRANILKDNIVKWGAANVIVTNNDPKDFAKLEDYFDVIVIDAPCSGSGLFRREPEAIGEWSVNNVALCSQRQQRILSDVWPALKRDGILIYSTCSYSKEEDEEIMDWLSEQFAVQNLKLNIPGEWHITETSTDKDNYGYRFWPDKVKGEGFFISCFQKKEGDLSWHDKTKMKADPVSKNEIGMVRQWIDAEEYKFIKHENTVYAWPESLYGDMTVVLSALRVIYSGVRAGELVKNKMIPDHALVMSRILRIDTPALELNYEDAIRYLQRKDLSVIPPDKGWQRVTYEGHSLGWVNVLLNRINNYYPKELRILKDNNKL